MYTRYDVRNACLRLAKGLDPRIPELKDILQDKIRETNYNWTSFGSKFDAVIVNNEIHFIAAIKDLDEVKSVCSRRQMIEELGVEKNDWADREIAIIDAMEVQFLDGIMDWRNYKNTWDVKMDTDRGSVVTFLTGQKPYQISQEEIDAKLQEMMKPTESPIPEENTITLTLGSDED